MPRLAVILPVRNGAAYIRTSVTSTLQALPRDAELTVLDDGSTDHTSEILQSIEDRRLRILRREHSDGLTSGLNLLVRETDSEIIGRMDADDICLPWRFRHQIKEYNRGIQFVFSQVLHLGPRRLEVRPTRLHALDSVTIPLQLLVENPLAHPTALFSRSAIEELGCYRKVLAEDYDLWLRAAARGFSMRRTAIPVLLYRHHGGQVTNQAAWKAKSRIEPELVAAHSELAKSTVGLLDDRLSGLRSPAPTQSDLDRSAELVGALCRLVRSSATSRTRRRLSKKLREVEARILGMSSHAH